MRGRIVSKKAVILIDVEKGKAGLVAAKLKNKPGLMTSDFIFDDHDIIAVIRASNANDLSRIVREEIVPADSVRQTHTLVVYSDNE